MKYTIKDLADGKVAVHNNTSGELHNREGLQKVIAIAFPRSAHDVPFGDSEYYLSDGKGGWTVKAKPEVPIQDLQVFLNEIQGIKHKKDSKLIRRFPSGAVRSNSTNRPRPDWVSPYAVEAIGQHLAGNANDFGAVNYFLGIPEEACLESLTRHYIELNEAMLITKDGKATKEAVTALAFNAVAMLHTIILKEKGLYKEVYDKTELITVEEAKKGVKFTGK